MKLTVFGPPGTGKTYRLIQEVGELLKVYHPGDIAFVSFTRRGAIEGFTRAKSTFGYKPDDFTLFRTIHSLCYRVCKGSGEVLQPKHARLFEKSTGFTLEPVKEEEIAFRSVDLFSAYNIIRNNPALKEQTLEYLNVKQYEKFVKVYEDFKSKYNVMDFTDLLIRYVKNGDPLDVSAAIIDEAQDLTPLQWQVVTKMFSRANDLILAGDDDQAVFSWAGADVEQFLSYTQDHEVLEQSYRMPRAVYSYAEKITADIQVRKSKLFRPRDAEGILDVTDRAYVNPDESALILSRTNAALTPVVQELRLIGEPYELHGEPSINSRVLHAIQRFIAWNEGKLNKSKLMVYSSYFKDDPTKYCDWRDCIDLQPEEAEYYDAVLSSERTEEELLHPKLRIDTIHSAKGAEADHVYLMLDMPRLAMLTMQNTPDFENRVYYVGATRAREHLTLCLSNSKYSYKLYNPEVV